MNELQDDLKITTAGGAQLYLTHVGKHQFTLELRRGQQRFACELGYEDHRRIWEWYCDLWGGILRSGPEAGRSVR